jgi:hypothetical protein
MITSLASMTNSLFDLKKIQKLYTMSDIPGIRILSSLNDLDSLISSKNLLNLMVLSINPGNKMT